MSLQPDSPSYPFLQPRSARTFFLLVLAVVGCNAESKIGTLPPPTTIPQVQVAPSVVSFQYAIGGPVPSPISVNVSGNGGQVTGLQVGTILYSPISSGWLAADYGSGGVATPTTVVLTPNPPADLLPGTYVASVPVQSTVTGVTAQYILATLTIDSIPVIELSPDTVLMAATAGGASPGAQTVQVLNGGGLILSGLSVGTISYAGGQSGWLSASLNQATAPATISLQATTGGLPAGTYVAQVPIRSSLAGVVPDTITVSVGVSALPNPPSIALSPTNLSVSATAGGSNPAAQVVGISNGGGGSLTGLSVGSTTYVTGQGGWLTATLNGTTAPATVTVQAATGTRAVGTYRADVRIQSSLAGVATRTFRVTFNVTAAGSLPSINLAPSTVPLAATQGGASPAPIIINVSNGGGGTLNLLAVGTISYGPGATGWLASSLSNTTAPATITLTPTTGALTAGAYSATVPVTSGVIGVTAASITVNLIVTNPTAAPLLALTPADWNTTATVGGANPAPAVVAVSNAGGGSLSGLAVGTVNYTAGGATGWLSGSLNQATAPAVLTLTANIAGLAAGTYRAVIPITSPVATNSPRGVGVRLIVGTAPTMTLTPATVTFTGTTGAPNPTPVSVNVANVGTGSLAGLSISGTVYGAGQPTGWLTSTLSGNSTPAALVLAPALGSLAAGTYAATVTVASTTPGVASKSVAVSFQVGAPAGGFVILQGADQTGLVNTVLALPLKAQLLDAAGNPRVGASVVWQVNNGGSLQGTVSTTSAIGEVTTNWKVGPLAGIHTVSLSAPGVPTVTFFSDVLLPPNPAGHPNEPAGFFAFAEHNLSSLPAKARGLGGLMGGWYAIGSNNLAVVTPDLTAPESPPNVLSMRFPKNQQGGTGPVNFGGWDIAGKTNGQKSKVYFSMWVKCVGPDYENHHTGTKFGFFGAATSTANSAHNSWFFIDGTGTQQILPDWKLTLHQSFPTLSPNTRQLPQNVDARRLFTCGTWHQWEAILELNTLGQANGLFKWWIDGIKMFDYSDLTYIYAGNTNKFFDFVMNPTWGGGPASKTRDDFFLIDHLYMSGIP